MAEGQELLSAIRTHYDQLSFFYRLFWGDHIHHGYWEDNETPAVAQENLIARLTEFAAVPRGGRVLLAFAAAVTLATAALSGLLALRPLRRTGPAVLLRG